MIRFQRELVNAQHFDAAFVFRKLRLDRAFYFTAMPKLVGFLKTEPNKQNQTTPRIFKTSCYISLSMACFVLLEMWSLLVVVKTVALLKMWNMFSDCFVFSADRIEPLLLSQGICGCHTGIVGSGKRSGVYLCSLSPELRFSPKPHTCSDFISHWAASLVSLHLCRNMSSVPFYTGVSRGLDPGI